MRVLGLTAGAAVVGLVCASVLATENALFIRDHPQPATRSADDLTRQTHATWEPAQVTAADGAVLQGWLFTPSQRNGAGVILLHGVADTRLGMMAHADFLLRAGYTVLTPDSRGHGSSGGEFLTYGIREAEDVHRWAQWMGTRVDRLHGLGESMGAAILLQSLAREPRFRSVVAECPFASFAEIARDRLSQATGAPAWLFAPVAKIGFGYARLRYGVDLGAASPVEAVRTAAIPILLIHGDHDGNIPIRHSREIAAPNPRWVRLWEVHGADHVNAYAVEPERYKREVRAWFDRR